MLLFAIACQKSSFTTNEDTTKKSSNPRAVKNPQTHFIGFGYDATGDYAVELAVRNSIIDVGKYRSGSESGRFSDGAIQVQNSIQQSGENAEQYSRKISNQVNVTSGLSLFGGSVSSSYNAFNETTLTFDGKYIYANYDLLIKKRRLSINTTAESLRNYLTTEFTEDLNRLTPQALVAAYGTHVMTDIYAGGKLKLLYQAETRNTNREEAAKAGVNVSASFIFNFSVENTNEYNLNQASQNFSQTLKYSTYGGNASIPIVGTFNLETGSRPTINSTPWQNSVSYENAELIDFGPNGLIPIYDLITDANKRASIKTYIDQYIISRSLKSIFFRVPIYNMSNSYSVTNSKNIDDLYTINPQVESNSYRNLGTKFYAFSYKAPGTSPVYRYYSSYYNNTFYTTTPQSENLQTYSLQRIEFYAYLKPSSTLSVPTVPIYRYYGDFNINHQYTPNFFANTPYYKFERIEFHAHSN